MSWIAIAKSPDAAMGVPRDLLKEALAVAPDAVIRSAAPLLPLRSQSGQCQLCGRRAPLTKEHIPPRASVGNARTTSYSLCDYLEQDTLDIAGGKPFQGGIYVFTLCRECNNGTGRYGNEYKGWVIRAIKLIQQLDHPEQLTRKVGPQCAQVRFGSQADGGVRPGAFVRQALSMMCSISGDWDLAGQHQSVRDIVLDGRVGKLPEGLSLSLSLYLGPMIRISGPSLSVNLDSGLWRWVLEVARPPLALLMTLASNGEPTGVLDISDLCEVSPERVASYSGTLEVGFGYTPWPGDYRSRAAIEADKA